VRSFRNSQPKEVDAAERVQVCEKTSLLVVVAIEPTWGGGIEVEMANRSGVPVLLLCPRRKLEARRISRLLLGNPAVIGVVAYDSDADALAQLRIKLRRTVLARPTASTVLFDSFS
jgi:hypothetical protein